MLVNADKRCIKPKELEKYLGELFLKEADL